jgi:hypothetical protein
MNRVSFQPVLTLFALLLAALSPPAYTQQWPAADPVVTVDLSRHEPRALGVDPSSRRQRPFSL